MKLLYIALRLDCTGDGASIYAMSNVLAFASQIQTDVITLQAPQTSEGWTALHQARVSLTAITPEPYHPWRARLLLLKRGHNIFRESEQLQQAVQKQVTYQKYTIVVLELATAYLMPLIRLWTPQTRIILSQHNYEYSNHLEYIRYRIKHPLKKIGYRMANYKYQSVEHTYIQQADAVIAISEADCRQFQCLRDREIGTYVMPPALSLKPEKTKYADTCTRILFVGMMDWYPNIQGVLQFVKQVFLPLVRKNPVYHLYIVGKQPSSEIRALQSDHITVTGAVPYIDDYVRLCDLLVVPNTLGGGVKIKIMEAIQKGIPLLIHKYSAVGYEEIVPFSIVQNMQQFIDRIETYSEERETHIQALNKARIALATRIVQNQQLAHLIIHQFANVPFTSKTT